MNFHLCGETISSSSNEERGWLKYLEVVRGEISSLGTSITKTGWAANWGGGSKVGALEGGKRVLIFERLGVEKGGRRFERKEGD
jgi:hypothetical protein